MLCVFPITLTGAAKRWVDRFPLGTVNSWDLLKKAFIQRYCPPSRTAKQLEEIRNFKQEGDETLYQAWEWYNDLLYKCPTHDINNHQKTMADHSQKWHDGSSSRSIEGSSSEGITAIVNKLENLDLETKVKTLANEVEGRTNNGKFEECKTNCTEDVSPLYTPFYYSPEEIEYFSANSGFSDNEKQETDDLGLAEAVAALEATLKKKKEERKKEKQNVNYYVDSYEPLIPFPKRLEHHAEEALVHQTMESLKKIKINRPLLKEIRQTDNYAKQMKDLVENKPRTEEDGEIRMNPRCFALLQNHLPPKEQDPGTFILPCSIGKLDFKNALADLGASISVMPFSMYKLLGIGKLEPINMVIEMADNTKCTPKGIVENLLIKIDRFIFPIDFVILDMVEDIRMSIVLGRPLLATAHTKVDIFRKSISLEVGSKKVIFKIRSSFTTTNFECVRLIKSETLLEDEDFKKIDYDLFLYNSESWKEFSRTTRKKILEDEENDSDKNLEDPDEYGEDKANAILEVIHDKLNDDWFINTSEDEDDLEGILDYLKPRSYDGFINLDDEAYNNKRCKLLGMTYEEPNPILIKKAKVTRYIIGPGETYTKVRGLGIEKIPRTKDNVAAMRARLMKKMAYEGNRQAKTFLILDRLWPATQIISCERATADVVRSRTLEGAWRSSHKGVFHEPLVETVARKFIIHVLQGLESQQETHVISESDPVLSSFMALVLSSPKATAPLQGAAVSVSLSVRSEW
ncbi:zinc knuckle CX2CX4HX4C containing protein [Tanacetum coccineum]